jgi:GGDEF domain-containing protein
VEISIAAHRLQIAASALNSEPGRAYPLSFSTGYVTAKEHDLQSLKELLTAADKAMYDEKRHQRQKHV